MTITCRNRRNHVKVNREKNVCVWARGDFYSIVPLFKERTVGWRKSRRPVAIPNNILKDKMQQRCNPAKRLGGLAEKVQRLVGQVSVLKFGKQNQRAMKTLD